MEVPIYYNYQTSMSANSEPSFTHFNDATTRYYVRYLLKRAMSVFEFELPENWDPRFFKYVLFETGRVGVIKSMYGVIPVMAQLSGYNLYYAPSRILVANPNLPQKENGEYRIGNVKLVLGSEKTRSAGLITLQPDYTGALPSCYETAQKLALIQQNVIMNLQNSKFAYVFFGDNKAAAETFKTLYDSIQSGNPAVATTSKMKNAKGDATWELFLNDLKRNYIVTDLLEDGRRVLNDFCSLWGIPSTNYGKRERMTVDEVNANNIETETLVDICLETLQDGINNVNEMFNGQLQGNLAVHKRYGEGGV